MKKVDHLIQKYNRPGPRYTSFPPVPFWHNTPDEATWLTHIKEQYDAETGVDLYVHVPYCESLCYYCGCNRTITKNHDVEDPYMKQVMREWELYQEKLGFTPKVNSLHFGGGTPTFLSPDNLDLLLKALLKKKSDEFIGSIEVDPRTCSKKHIDVLVKNGIKRVSMGIQDFDPEVQRLINRNQSVELVTELVNYVREKGIHSINFDLIYGLPRQTKETIARTMEHVMRMNPDLIAFYSYAHLPDRIKNQRLIPEDKLPQGDKKRELYETGKELLLKAGYFDVGMDHFAKPGSYLYEAKEENKLHRNFMGYVDKKSSILIGLGPTSISDSSLSFVQNIKDMKGYGEKIMKGELPFDKGHTHSEWDIQVRDIMMDLMCQGKAKIESTTLPYKIETIAELRDLAEDGIIELDSEEVKITDIGTAFMRNVAMTFDFYLREQGQKVKFSQTI